MKGGKASAPTRILSVRVSTALAESVRTRAAARHISVSAYIADVLSAKRRPEYPALAALGEMIALAHHCREHAPDAALLADFDAMIERLCDAAREEVRG